MLKFTIAFLIISFIGFSCYRAETVSNSDTIRKYYLEKANNVSVLVNELKIAIEKDAPEAELQSLFKKCRLAYKSTEFLSEYYTGSVGRFINGAPIPDIEADEQQRLIKPEGFQVIEPFLFPKYIKENRSELLAETSRLLSNVNKLKLLAESNAFADDHIFDAMRLQLFRIVTLGISGFDAAIAQNSLEEASASLTSLSELLAIYKDKLEEKDKDLYLKTQSLFSESIKYLSSNTDFNSFNRMAFITDHLNPLSASIVKCSKALGLKKMEDLRGLKSDASTLFEKGAFDPNYFSPNLEAHTTKEKEELGKLLFFDPVLSGSNNRSCVSCHQPNKAFTDGLTKNLTITGNKTVLRNTPTVLNAGFQASLFYDSRVSFLEDQATAVITNADEMHGSLDVAVKKLKASKEYSELFDKAFPGSKEHLTEYNLRNAIASYIRSLTSLDSKFDKYVRGDKSQLKQNEITGFNLYMGKAKCGTCHFTPLFNGTVPPGYTETESEVIGVLSSATSKKIDTDRGRFSNRQLTLQDNSFRTPTVRNIALTAPYMHNGIYKTLEEVIDFYNDGGGSGLGIELENQTLPFDELKLTKREKQDIIAFLKTLTDNSKAKEIPKELPALGAKEKKRLVSLSY